MIDLARELADYTGDPVDKPYRPGSWPAPRGGGRWTDRPLSTDLADTSQMTQLPPSRGYGFGLAVGSGGGGSGGWDATAWPGYEHRCAQCQRHLPTRTHVLPPEVVTLYCDECIAMRK